MRKSGRAYTLTGFPADIISEEEWRAYIAERQAVLDGLRRALKADRETRALTDRPRCKPW
ncbi:hypothetical protein GC169_04325 [bacterium]|nr:hypothetical protein [bacterium]